MPKYQPSKYQCETCYYRYLEKKCWSEYPTATHCQDYKKEQNCEEISKEIKNEGDKLSV